MDGEIQRLSVKCMAVARDILRYGKDWQDICQHGGWPGETLVLEANRDNICFIGMGVFFLFVSYICIIMSSDDMIKKHLIFSFIFGRPPEIDVAEGKAKGRALSSGATLVCQSVKATGACVVYCLIYSVCM